MEQKVSKVDYSKSLIYKLCCKDTNIKDIYIGSTTNMKQRKQNHKNSCNNPNSKKYNYKVYQTIREYGGFDNWDIILVEYVNATSKQELEKEERVVIELLQPTLNSNIPTRTHKEWSEKYYIDNKKEIKEKRKVKYQDNKKEIKEKQQIKYQNNKEELNEKRKVTVKCEFCECVVRKYYLKQHQKGIKCKKFQLLED